MHGPDQRRDLVPPGEPFRLHAPKQTGFENPGFDDRQSRERGTGQRRPEHAKTLERGASGIDLTDSDDRARRHGTSLGIGPRWIKDSTDRGLRGFSGAPYELDQNWIALELLPQRSAYELELLGRKLAQQVRHGFVDAEIQILFDAELAAR
jgi:hypothetical protein